MTYSEWANWPISLSIVLLAGSISVVQFRDVPLGTGRRNVLMVDIWRGVGVGRVFRQSRGGIKGKIKVLRNKGSIQGLRRLRLGWKAGVCCRHLRRRSEGHVVAGGLGSATAQVMESSPMRLQRNREKKEERRDLRMEIEKNSKRRQKGEAGIRRIKLEKKRNEEGKGK